MPQRHHTDLASSKANPINAYGYFEDYHWWFLGRRRIMQELVHYLVEPSRDALIIDVGCGPGANIGSLAGSYRCMGIDLSEEAIEIARARYPMVDFVCGLVPEALGNAGGASRAFLVMDLLEHVQGDREMLHSLVAIGSPGAYYLITVPADPRLWSPHDEAAGHYRRYTLSTLADLWKGLPVDPLLVTPFNARLYPPTRLVRAVTSRLRRTHGTANAEGLDLRVPRAPLNGMLTALFSNEAMAIGRSLRQPGRAPFKRGVSLLAVLRRTEGEFEAPEEPLAASAFTETELGTSAS